MQNIDPEPSPAQVWTLQEAYRRFAATGRWPSFGELDRALDKQGIDLMEVSQGLSRQLSNLGSLRLSSRDDVILQPEALPYCRPDSQGDMDLILGIIWHATERYSSYDPAPGDPDEPRITGEELSRSLGFPESRLLRLYPLLIREDWTGSTSISEDGHFYLFVTREIRKYRGIQTYADYLRKRAETRNRVPDPVAGIRAATSLLNQRVAAVSVLNQGGGNDATQAPSQSSQAARTVSTTHVHDKPYRYEVALSFAGEDRVYVEQVAAILKNANVPLFYDRYEEANLWGKDLVAHLDNVYRKQSRFIVVFVSKHYAAKACPDMKPAVLLHEQSNSRVSLCSPLDLTILISQASNQASGMFPVGPGHLTRWLVSSSRKSMLWLRLTLLNQVARRTPFRIALKTASHSVTIIRSARKRITENRMSLPV